MFVCDLKRTTYCWLYIWFLYLCRISEFNLCFASLILATNDNDFDTNYSSKPTFVLFYKSKYIDMNLVLCVCLFEKKKFNSIFSFRWIQTNFIKIVDAYHPSQYFFRNMKLKNKNLRVIVLNFNEILHSVYEWYCLLLNQSTRLSKLTNRRLCLLNLWFSNMEII